MNNEKEFDFKGYLKNNPLLKETNININVNESQLRERVRAEILSALKENDTNEAEEKDQPEEETTPEVADVEPEITGDEKLVQDALTKAYEAASKMGDKKLLDQIGNTITFFTRSHIVSNK